MVKNHKLAKSLQDVAFGELRRQLEYKGKDVRFIGRFEPSTQTCSSCGHIQNMSLDKRTYKCLQCGLSLDRDVNAARNILAWATREVTPVNMVSDFAEQSSRGLKQEFNSSLVRDKIA
jgi:putative transposase